MKYNTVKLHCSVEKSFIAYLKNIIEAYDNMAVLTTVDSMGGVICLSIAPGCERLVTEILRNLSETASIDFL